MAGTPVFLLENPMDRQAWRSTVPGVTESQTQPKQPSTQMTVLYCIIHICHIHLTIPLLIGV